MSDLPSFEKGGGEIPRVAGANPWPLSNKESVVVPPWEDAGLIT
jgi:hypothetical protein